MIELNDRRWNELSHAYGPAGNIPELLQQLSTFPPQTNNQSEPYFSLWSALCHQGDVYTASYAAVPHIIKYAEFAPSKVNWSAILLVTSIEIGRMKSQAPDIPADLAKPYFDSLTSLPRIIAETAEQEWDEFFARVASAALAVAKEQPKLGEAILELEPERVPVFLEWVTEELVLNQEDTPDSKSVR